MCKIFIFFGKLEEIVSTMQNDDDVSKNAFDYK